MKIFITGATGYVGSHLVKALVNHGHSITAFIRPSSNHTELEKLGVHICFGDITNKESILNGAQENYDAVIHLCYSLFPLSDRKVNIDGVKNMIDVFQNKRIKRFIYLSSALVYGSTVQNINVREDYPCNPNMNFAKQQLKAENLLLNAFKNNDLPVVILRPSEIFGGTGGYFKEEYFKGIVEGKIPILGKGTNNVSMSYIDDVVQAVNSSLKIENIEGQVFNINIPEVITIRNLVEFLTNKTGTKMPVRLPKAMAFFAATFIMIISKLMQKKPLLNYDIVRVATLQCGLRDINKAQKILGFKPEYAGILEGIEKSYF